MITSLHGKIQEIDDNVISILVNQVGYGVAVPNPTLFNLNQEISLFTRLLWNQEDGPQLFGFLSKNDRLLFDLVVSCSGFGAKIALAVVASMKLEIFMRAVTERDAKLLSSVPGIGMKKAEVIILQLKERVAKLLKHGFALEELGNFNILNDLSAVLASLGYSKKDIEAATSFARSELTYQAPLDEFLRKALSYLVKKI